MEPATHSGHLPARVWGTHLGISLPLLSVRDTDFYHALPEAIKRNALPYSRELVAGPDGAGIWGSSQRITQYVR